VLKIDGSFEIKMGQNADSLLQEELLCERILGILPSLLNSRFFRKKYMVSLI